MSTLKEELEKQVAAEIGDDEVNPKVLNELLQKFGLASSQLTASEKRLIQREERKNAGK